MNMHDKYCLSVYLIFRNGHSTTCSTVYTSRDSMISGISTILDALTKEETTDWLIIGAGMVVASEVVSINFRVSYQDLVQNGSSPWIAYEDTDICDFLHEANALLDNARKGN